MLLLISPFVFMISCFFKEEILSKRRKIVNKIKDSDFKKKRCRSLCSIGGIVDFDVLFFFFFFYLFFFSFDFINVNERRFKSRSRMLFFFFFFFFFQKKKKKKKKRRLTVSNKTPINIIFTKQVKLVEGMDAPYQLQHRLTNR